MDPDFVPCVLRNAFGGAGFGLVGGWGLQMTLRGQGLIGAHLPPGNGRALHLFTEFMAGGAVAGFVLGALVGAWLKMPARDEPADEG